MPTLFATAKVFRPTSPYLHPPRTRRFDAASSRPASSRSRPSWTDATATTCDCDICPSVQDRGAQDLDLWAQGDPNYGRNARPPTRLTCSRGGGAAYDGVRVLCQHEITRRSAEVATTPWCRSTTAATRETSCGVAADLGDSRNGPSDPRLPNGGGYRMTTSTTNCGRGTRPGTSTPELVRRLHPLLPASGNVSSLNNVCRSGGTAGPDGRDSARPGSRDEFQTASILKAGAPAVFKPGSNPYCHQAEQLSPP